MGTFEFLMIVIILVSVLLVLVILSQNPKGGGLSSTFGGSGSGQMFGVQRTNDFLDKATWTLVGVVVILIIAANVLKENPNALNIPAQSPRTTTEQSAEPAAANENGAATETPADN